MAQEGRMDERLKYVSERAKVADLPLSFPGKVLADAKGGRLFIADSNHNRIVVTKLDGTLITTIGTGARGAADGPFDRATFNRPQGLALDAGQNGDEGALYVADTENQLVRKVDLKTRTVTTIAGAGRQPHANPGEDSAPPARSVALYSPWDLQLVSRRLYIAMAGSHQIWRLNLTTNTISVFAGSGREARANGSRQTAAFAQPSGLTGDGTTLYVADAESNVIRSVDLARGAKPSADDEPKTEVDGEGLPLVLPPKGQMTPLDEDETKAVASVKPPPPTAPQVSTLAGGDLSGSGDEDGTGDAVRLQHPLGVLYVEGYGVFIADTYNHKIKLLDPLTRAVKTVAGTGKPGQVDGDHASFDEPGGLSYANGKLYVADTNNHAIRVVDPATGRTSTLTLRGLAPPAASPSPPDANAPRGIKPQVKIE
jgi:sugar lactone lactonase YvrE